MVQWYPTMYHHVRITRAFARTGCIIWYIESANGTRYGTRKESIPLSYTLHGTLYQPVGSRRDESPTFPPFFGTQWYTDWYPHGLSRTDPQAEANQSDS